MHPNSIILDVCSVPVRAQVSSSTYPNHRRTLIAFVRSSSSESNTRHFENEGIKSAIHKSTLDLCAAIDSFKTSDPQLRPTPGGPLDRCIHQMIATSIYMRDVSHHESRYSHIPICYSHMEFCCGHMHSDYNARIGQHFVSTFKPSSSTTYLGNETVIVLVGKSSVR